MSFNSRPTGNLATNEKLPYFMTMGPKNKTHLHTASAPKEYMSGRETQQLSNECLQKNAC